MDKKATHTIELFKPQPNKVYFKQEYNADSTSESGHTPDYRHQLLWKPDVTMDTLEMKIDFFTSEVTGEFEICIEGFTDQGEPVSLREALVVE